MGISRQTPASCYAVSADVFLAWNLNTKVQRHFQTPNERQDHQAERHPSWSSSPPRREGWGWLEPGKKSMMIRNKRWANWTVYSRGGNPDWRLGPQTDSMWGSVWRTQLLFTREGWKQRGPGEAEQMEESGAIRKVREPTDTPDSHKWKWQTEIHPTARTNSLIKKNITFEDK